MKQSKISFSNSKRSSSGSTLYGSKKRQRKASPVRRTVSEIEIISSDDDKAEKKNVTEEESLSKKMKHERDARTVFGSRDGRENVVLSSLDKHSDGQGYDIDDDTHYNKSGRLQASKYSMYWKDVQDKMGYLPPSMYLLLYLH
jgi:hypothetical protein